MSTAQELRIALIAQQWEKTKGELRAIVAMHGSLYTCNSDKYVTAQMHVESFIRQFEDVGLDEA